MPKNKINKAWNFHDPENGVAEVTIYGTITDNVDWENGEINPEFFSSDLNYLAQEHDIKELIIRINSNGGDVFAATAIYTRLKEFKAHKTVKIDGWAASAATIIAMAGDVIEIAPNGSLMIHDPLFGLDGYFNSTDLKRYVEQLESIKKSIINAYKEKTGKSEEELSQIMEVETWYTGKEAVEAGFCDKLMFEEADIVATATGDIKVNGVNMGNNFSNIPNTILKHCQNHATDKVFNINTNKRKEKSNMGKEVKNETEVNEITTVEELKEAYPDLVKEIEEAAKQEELDRLKSIEEIETPGAEDIVNEAKYNTRISAGELAVQILNKQKAAGANFINQRQEDVTNSGMQGVKGETGKDQEKDKEKGNEYIDAINKVFPKTK